MCISVGGSLVQGACQTELLQGASGGVYPLLDGNEPSKSLVEINEVKQIEGDNTPQPDGDKPSTGPLSEVAVCASGGEKSDVGGIVPFQSILNREIDEKELREEEGQGTSSSLISAWLFLYFFSPPPP